MRPSYYKKINITGVRQTVLDQARGRLILISILFVACFVVVVARAADLSLIHAAVSEGVEDDFREDASLEDVKKRADIIDRNGVLLARSLSAPSLFADASLVLDPKKVAKDLKIVFPDISYDSVLQKLQSKKKFVWIKRNLSPKQQSQILYLGHPSLRFKTEMTRVYPQGELAVHLVGTSGVDGQGLMGLEGNYNNLLSEGEPLQLTIDVRLQYALKREIDTAIKEFNGIGGAGVVMDIETGDVLAAVSLPDFLPSQYQKAKDNQKFNRFSQGVYELGSSFKVFSTAAMLEANNNKISQRFDVREPLVVGRHKIRDYHPEKRILSLPEVFMHSSNIGSAMMGKAVGTDSLKKFYGDLGLLSAPVFGISEVGRPIVPDPWGDVHTLTASFGHGIAVSPLQLVSATSSILNGGIVVKPNIIKNSSNDNKNQSDLRVVSAETSHRMRQLMRLVVTEGTGRKADLDGYLIGGKTGTAEKPGRGGYDRKRLISSFLGAFPMNDPRYVVFAMVDEPKGTKATYGYATGGWVGAPTVKRIASSMVSILGIEPIDEKEKFEGSLMRYVKTKEQIKKEKEEQKIAAH